MGKFNEKDVPSWCKWIAVDKNGDCWAFSHKPVIDNKEGEWDFSFKNWNNSIEYELYRGKPPKNWKDEIYTWG